MAYLLFLGLCTIWGTNFILMKKATLWFDPVTVGALRIVGGMAFLGAIQLIRRSPWPVRRADLGALLFVAVFGYAFPFALQPILIQRCGSGFIGIMVSFVPLMTILVSIPMLGIFPSARQLLGVLGGLAFLLLIMKDGMDRSISIWDFLLAATVPLFYSICNTFIKRRFVGMTPLPLALSCLSMACLVLGPYAALFPRKDGADPDSFALAVGAVGLLGLVGTGFGAYAFTKLLQDRGPLFAGMVTYLIPTIALVWGWFDHERVTALQVIALLGVLGMVAVVQYNPQATTDEPGAVETTSRPILVPAKESIRE